MKDIGGSEKTIDSVWNILNIRYLSDILQTYTHGKYSRETNNNM